MTSEGFAADLGTMIGDAADLAPLMGTLSFSGRDPNKHDDSDENKDGVKHEKGRESFVPDNAPE